LYLEKTWAQLRRLLGRMAIRPDVSNGAGDTSEWFDVQLGNQPRLDNLNGNDRPGVLIPTQEYLFKRSVRHHAVGAN